MTAETIIDKVIKAEGSAFTNDPLDSGGPTKYGITQAALAAYKGFAVSAAEVSRLTEADAREIYRKRYIIDHGFLPVVELSDILGAELVDTGVNMGPARAAMFLQRSLNALNLGGKQFADVRVDGECGPATIEALQTYLRRRGKEGELVLLAALNALQGEYYIDLAERRPKDEAFVYGWLRARVVG